MPRARQRRQGMTDVDLAIIHLTFEGIQTYGGGVATVTRGHLGAMPRLRDALAKEGVLLTPYFAEIAYRADHPRRDRKFEQEAVARLREMGGELAYLVNYSAGLVPQAVWGVADIGSLENWKVASAAGAAVALNFARGHQAAVIYCHDIVFALAALYASLQEPAFEVRASAIYVVHSSALTHELPLPNPERLMAESAVVHWSKVAPSCRLGYISRFIAAHLREDYGAAEASLVPTGNGINPQDQYFRERDAATIQAKLAQHNIPLDRPLVFSWGRPVAYKRYDVLLKAAAQAGGSFHPVIMLSEDSPDLRRLALSLGLDITLIAAFDPELVACVLQWPGTVAAASLAYREPFGLTPIEVRMLARRQGALMVVSDTGGLAEQVSDGVDGFVTKQDDAQSVASVLQRVAALDPQERERVRRAGLETVLREYTWSSQILKTLTVTYPEWCDRFERVRDRLKNEDLTALGLRARSV